MTDISENNSISPRDFIAHLKAQYPPKASEPISISPTLIEMQGGDMEKCKQIVSSYLEEDLSYALLRQFMSGLPDAIREAIDEGLIAVGEVNDHEPNATVHRLHGPSYAVSFNSGLSRFIYRVTRALSTRFYPTGTQPDPTLLPFEDTCRIITDIFFWYSETHQSFGPDYAVTEQQMTIASLLATEAECFFLAHEFGHIYNDLYAISEDLSEDDRSVLWADEFLADRFASTVMLKARNSDNSDTSSKLCYAGAETAILIFAALEKLGVKHQASHPPAIKRLSHLREHLRILCENDTIYGQITTLSRPLETLFNVIIDRINRPDWEDFINRATSGVMTELERALDQFSGGMVPDYYNFRMEFKTIFEKISSHRLYERIAIASANFVRQMEEYSKEKKNGRVASIAFQKYKLFLNAIEQFNEPAKSLFQQALKITDE